MMSARCLSTSGVANTRPCSNFTVVHKRGMFDVEDGKLRLYIVQCVDNAYRCASFEDYTMSCYARIRCNGIRCVNI